MDKVVEFFAKIMILVLCLAIIVGVAALLVSFIHDVILHH